MIIVMKHDASKKEIGNLTDHLTTCGYRLTISEGVERTVIGAIGDESLRSEEHTSELQSQR